MEESTCVLLLQMRNEFFLIHRHKLMDFSNAIQAIRGNHNAATTQHEKRNKSCI